MTFADPLDTSRRLNLLLPEQNTPEGAKRMEMTLSAGKGRQGTWEWVHRDGNSNKDL